MFKPFVGGISALVVYSVLKSGLLPITFRFSDENKPQKDLLGFAVIGFVSGFSERLIKDIIDKTENSLTPNTPEPNQELSSSSPPNVSEDIQVTPSEVNLYYGQQHSFNIQPSQHYQVTLNPPNIGSISGQTDSTFIYTAPSQETAQGIDEVTITITSTLNQSYSSATVRFNRLPAEVREQGTGNRE
jgi:hypothetical protein